MPCLERCKDRAGVTDYLSYRTFNASLVNLNPALTIMISVLSALFYDTEFQWPQPTRRIPSGNMRKPDAHGTDYRALDSG